MSYSHLLPPSYKEEVKEWLRDDCPIFDIGGFVVGEKIEKATLLCKTSCILSGKPYASAVFEQLELKVTWNYDDGDIIDINNSSDKKIIIAIVEGKCKNILLAERVALNILSRSSGIATTAKEAVDIGKSMNWNGYIAGTRKTTPGFKNVEKYSLLVGGAATHRYDLSQMVMLKDNHIWSCGNITSAVKKARCAAGFSMKIEVECQSIEEACEAANAGADIVMLDNFSSDTINNAANQVKEKYPHVLIEASGGITADNLHLYMGKSIDIISRGNLTQGYKCMDFSLKISSNKG